MVNLKFEIDVVGIGELMLWELDRIVERYYKWTKITESCMTEMHGNKRHGYAIDVYDSNIYEAKYYNGELVMIIIRRLHDLRIYSIKYLDTGRILHDNGELTYFRIKMGNFYLSNGFYENGKFRYSIITDGSNSYCAKYDGNGKCTLYRNSEEY